MRTLPSTSTSDCPTRDLIPVVLDTEGYPKEHSRSSWKASSLVGHAQEGPEVPPADPGRPDDGRGGVGAAEPSGPTSTSTSWGRQNVYDVYSLSEKTGLDGTKYKDW